MEKTQKFAGRLSLLAAAFIWGTSFIVLKNSLGSMGPLWILTIRFTVSALLLSALSFRKLKTMPKSTLKGSTLLGIVLAAAYILQTYGLKYTTPGKNSFLTTVNCVLVPFIAWAIFKKKPSGANIAAGIMSLAGIGFVSLGSADGGFNTGDMLTLSCGVFYALHIILVEKYASGGDAGAVTAVQFASASAVTLAGALMFEDFPAAVPGSVWLGIAYLCIMCTALCYYLQAWGIKYTPASTASVLLCFESVFATVCSVIFCHEKITAKLLIGFALLFASVILSELNPGFSFRAKGKRAAVLNPSCDSTT